MQQILRSYWGAPWVVDANLQIGKCGAKDEIESSPDKQLLMQWWKEYGPALSGCPNVYSREHLLEMQQLSCQLIMFNFVKVKEGWSGVSLDKSWWRSHGLYFLDPGLSSAASL